MTATDPCHGLREARKESDNSQGKHWILWVPLTAPRSSSELPQGRLCCLDVEHSSGCDGQKSATRICLPASSAAECNTDCCIYSLFFTYPRKRVNSPSLLHTKNFKILPCALKSSIYLLRKSILQEPVWQRSHQHYLKSLLITKQSRWQIKSWTLHLPCLMNSLIT